MEMEVVIPIHNMDLDFNGARSSPAPFTAPSTPKRIGEYYFSAPTSPSRISQFYRDFEDLLITNGGEDSSQTGGGSVAAVPFDWEEKPGKPKSFKGGCSKEDDFAFDVSEDFETASVSAEELFDGGVIKPLKPPPRLQLPAAAISPRSHAKKAIRGAFSPKHKKETDPFATTAQRSSRRTSEGERGRERAPGISSSSRRATRSLSPLRVSEYPWEEEDQQQPSKAQSPVSGKPSSSPSNACSALSSSSSLKNFRKWSFKDFFLFRSASEGRAADKDPFRKYTAFRRYEEVKIASTRAIESSRSGSMSRRRGPAVSAHELHYTVNRAVSEDMKKKTFLPYKQGILGRLAFNPTVHALANGFGFSRN